MRRTSRPSDQVTDAHRSPRDFAGYAQLEALNIVLVPGIVLWFGCPRTMGEGVVLGSAILATIGFLAIGALYWRGVAERLRTANGSALHTAVQTADRWERPLIAVVVLASVLAIGGAAVFGWTGAIIAAGLLTTLAWLEYVNYYHWQLQNFDRMADYRRLIATRRVRRSHMARHLAKHRERRGSD